MQQSTHKQEKPNIITQILNKITDQKQFNSLKHAISNIPNHELQQQLQENTKKNSEQTIPLQKYHKIEATEIKMASKQQKNIELSQVSPATEKSSPGQKMEKETQQIIPITAEKSKKRQQQPREQPLSQPPLIAQRRLNTEQSSQKSKTYQKQSIFDSRKGKYRSSQQESINLELTQKTKKSKNLSNTQGRVDSLLYSDVTLMYSNDGGFDGTNNRNLSGKSQKSSSQKIILPKVPDNEGQEVNERIDRAQSRQCERIQTQSRIPTEQQSQSHVPTQQNEDAGIFKTEINEYRHKVSRIRELKEGKKRKLQAELMKVNEQLQNLNKQQKIIASPSISRANNYQSRVKISDNIEARAKAVKLVKDLRYQRRTRQDAHLQDLHVIDKNINGYMQELMRERAINQQRIKQRKKLEIISRMKLQQQRKIEEQKKKEMNQQFLQQLKGSNSKQNIQPKGQSRLAQESSHGSRAPAFAQPAKSKGRTPTKKSQPEEVTPELAKKKAYLKQIRNLSFRKSTVDPYEQALN